uniref:Uncharacterized protein n=1 Tax=Ammonifex degensii TaxID=42838 RepID=A0A7C1FE50_9THEO
MLRKVFIWCVLVLLLLSVIGKSERTLDARRAGGDQLRVGVGQKGRHITTEAGGSRNGTFFARLVELLK